MTDPGAVPSDRDKSVGKYVGVLSDHPFLDSDIWYYPSRTPSPSQRVLFGTLGIARCTLSSQCLPPLFDSLFPDPAVQ